jgi:predicted lipoprotein with Yx(FWY)xxD motif
MGVGKHRRRKAIRWVQLRLRVAGALLLAVSACIHLYLYVTGYRTIPTIGWLFLLQVIVASVLTVAALVTHSRLAAAASAGFALSTLSAYLLAVWIGLFGFKEVRTRAGIAAGLIEVAAFALLALAAITGDSAGQAERAERPARGGARLLARMQAAVAMVVGTVGAVSVAALVLLGFAVANADSPPVAVASARTGMTLRATIIHGVAVLTNAHGYTLYWFAPDTPAASRCSGSCTAYWPPVAGNPKAGPGVTGRLGTITRAGGSVQATYDGHPLYTYVGDNGPGQANGNHLDLNGGFWYEVRVSG